jgi:hypothetical protein
VGSPRAGILAARSIGVSFILNQGEGLLARRLRMPRWNSGTIAAELRCAVEGGKHRRTPMRIVMLSSALVASTLIGAPQAAFAQAYDKAFCLESAGLRNCIYDRFDQCEQALGGRAGACIPNPAGPTTTGAGAMSPPSPPSGSPGGGQYLPPPSQLPR